MDDASSPHAQKILAAIGVCLAAAAVLLVGWLALGLDVLKWAFIGAIIFGLGAAAGYLVTHVLRIPNDGATRPPPEDDKPGADNG